MTCGKNARIKNCEGGVQEYYRRRNSLGKPRKRWLDGVENSLEKMCVRGWRKILKDRDGWKLILKEARALHGQYSQ
jgi:hypothetical protein